MIKCQQRARARAFLARVRRPFTPRPRRWRTWRHRVMVDDELVVVTEIGPGYMEVLRAGTEVPFRLELRAKLEGGTWV